ncbi:arylesterase precursor [Vibrio nigripulchritudo ATCC 27043]|uniref:Arylesterase n=2 Tax=Vibrio nigripulchritudo TaxID=28173 RepID=U4KIM6_9VIBR|nr:GDSL-type esterase/lipase family protein [Vibrio nigripulchritudo]EGU50088.1 arylesterase precursor [Vibrio nigripulchritudo ATCC 27043]KJY76395.1 acyl-CoA thioesterase [Vibrio nigripulchritudo]CCO60945.1 Arylesterase [Vibrio nigripulchritudo]
MLRFLSVLFCFLFSTIASAQTLLILGDSLSAGYQMKAEQSWPSLLSHSLNEYDLNVSIQNGSVSGDTTGNGLAKLPGLLEEHSPNWVLIELGANDGLRGFPPKTINKNLRKLIELSEDSGATPILMQIRVPPNYGTRYSNLFADIYVDLADEYKIPLIPFFLEQVIIKPEWMMSDGLHPKPEAQPWISDFVAQQIAPILKNDTNY